MKARDIMTGSLITCSPEASVAEAARLMRERNTGDVLVTDDGKLVGIVTDRDIAVRVAAKELDPREVSIRHSMSKRVVTGQPAWDLDKVIKTMGKHQVRRLPIVDGGMLVGIVSLGDLALRTARDKHVAKSLKQISEPRTLHRIRRGRNRLMWTLGLGLLTGAVIAFTMSPKSFSNLWEQVQDSPVTDRLMDTMDQVKDTPWRDKLAEWMERVQDSDMADTLVNAFAEGRDRLAKMMA